MIINNDFCPVIVKNLKTLWAFYTKHFRMRTLFTLLFLFTTLYSQAAKTEYGLASIYSNEYKDSRTASGESYNPSKHTAAHKSLPFGSIVKVTNMESGKSVMVKINDRGPFIKGYVIELSGAAGEILNITKGKAKVKVEVEKEGEYPEDSELKEDSYFEDEDSNLADTPDTYNEDSNPFSETEPKVETSIAEVVTEAAEEDTTTKGDTEDAKEETPAKEKEAKTANELTTLKTKGYKVYDLYKASTFIPKASGYGVQVGTYHHLHNVLKETSKLQENWFSNILLTREVKGGKLTYKVIIGPFKERASADSYKKNAAKKGVKGFVVAVQPSKEKEVYQVKAVRPAKEGFAVQVMNLTDADNVVGEVEKLKNKWFKNILINVVKGKNNEPEYKLLLGPFPERKIANAYKESLSKKKMSGFVVDLSTIK